MVSMSQLIPAIALSLAMPMAAAGPTTIFADDFNRTDSNTVGNNWSEIQNVNNDVAIANGELRLRDQASGNNGTAAGPDAAVTRTISTLGFMNVEVAFMWRPLTASESTDFLNLAWKKSTDTIYTNVAALALGSNNTAFVPASFALGALANNTSIDLRFWTNVDASNEGAFLDSVTVTAVPEPTSVGLLGIGLFGAMLMRRRLKSDQVAR